MLTHSALKGRMAGLIVTFGLCTGLIGHTAAVALGLAVIFKVSPAAYKGLCGAAYLLYLAWHAFRASAEKMAEDNALGLQPWQLYRRGIIMNLTNPKVAVFFLAFLPQFTNPDRGSIPLQIMLLGLVFILSALLVFGAISLLGGSLAGLFNKSAGVQRALNIISGLIFVGIAVKLVFF
ncbi:MAG: LysE family translocator [Victivallaceae bacterium]